MADRDRTREVLDLYRANNAAKDQVISVQEMLIDLLAEIGGLKDRLPAAGATPTPAPGKESPACHDLGSAPASESPQKSPLEKPSESRPGGSRRYSTAELEALAESDLATLEQRTTLSNTSVSRKSASGG